MNKLTREEKKRFVDLVLSMEKREPKKQERSALYWGAKGWNEALTEMILKIMRS